MKEGWQLKRLADVSAINYGYTDSASSEPVGPRFLRITDIQDDRVDWTSVPYCKVGAADLPKYRLASGDIVFARTGATTGKSFLVDEPPDAVFASYLIRLRLLDKKLLPEFVSLFFQTAGYWKSIQEGSSGSAQGGFNATKLGELVMPIPPLPEQQRIVGILDEAFERIATAKVNCEKNLQNARALFASHLNAVFIQRGEGWVETNEPLSELCDLIVDCEHKTAPIQEHGIPSVRTPNIGKGRLLLEGVYRVSEETYLEWTRRAEPRAGDLILAREAPAGNVAVIPANTRVCLGQRTVLLRPKQKLFHSTFLAYLLLSPPIQSRLLAHSRGATVEHVNMKDIRALKVGSIPSLHMQKEIVSNLQSLDVETQRLESLYQRKLAALDELKKSLLHQAFSGELTEKPESAVVVPFPSKISGITTTDLHAGILAMAHKLHEQKGNSKHFGHVKAEKIAHMVEAWLGIDLDRKPIKDAAEPNDYPHQMSVEHRARKAGYFDFQQTNDAGYRVKKFPKFDSLIERTREKLGDRQQDIDDLLELMLPMNTQQAEIFCTVYAAWNNLLLDGQQPSDEEIVFESRENWHEAKLKIPREKFFAAIGWLKEQNMAPRGNGRKVLTKGKKK